MANCHPFVLPQVVTDLRGSSKLFGVKMCGTWIPCHGAEAPWIGSTSITPDQTSTSLVFWWCKERCFQEEASTHRSNLYEFLRSLSTVYVFDAQKEIIQTILLYSTKKLVQRRHFTIARLYSQWHSLHIWKLQRESIIPFVLMSKAYTRSRADFDAQSCCFCCSKMQDL